MLRITTESGSIYEINPEVKQIRRVFGNYPATVRVGNNDWRNYESINPHPSEHMVGLAMLISWRYNEEKGVLETTLTSTVRGFQDLSETDLMIS